MHVIMPVYIVNEELLQLTKEAIFSLGDVKLTIIDNASELGGGYLRVLADTYVRNKDNLGFAKAVNQGLKLLSSEYVAIANNDIRVSPNWQEVIKEVFQESKVYSCHFRMTNYDVPFKYGTKITYKGMERWCNGSFLVLRRHANDKLNILYDDNYFNSYEDWDLFHTIRSKGYYTAYTDKACFQHNHSFTQKIIPHREDSNLKNREYFKSKWGEYPEDLFQRLYPDQMSKDYYAEYDNL